MNGLVFAGGNSSRMALDKAELKYHGIEQHTYIYNLLSQLCNDVYISSRSISYSNLPMLFDSKIYGDIGPMAGILTAFDFEEIPWLITAIDYPCITYDELVELSNTENEYGSVMYNSITNYFEPYIGLYKPEIKSILLESVYKKEYSLQNILKRIPIEKRIPTDPETIRNINTKEEYDQYIAEWKSKK